MARRSCQPVALGKGKSGQALVIGAAGSEVGLHQGKRFYLLAPVNFFVQLFDGEAGEIFLTEAGQSEMEAERAFLTGPTQYFFEVGFERR